MKDVALVDGPVEMVGALDFDRTDSGITPRRLPAWTRPQIPDAFMDMMVKMPSGVRLRFETDATAIELDAELQHIQLLPLPLQPGVFDLVVDGSVVAHHATTEGTQITIGLHDPTDIRFEPGGPTTVRFEGLAEGRKTVEVWLPQRCPIELRAIRVDDGAAVERAAPPPSRRWVHYGSSISHCLEAASPTTTWPAVAARLGAVELFSLGFAGQCHVDPFVARTIRDLPADVISLKVGINLVNADSMRDRVFGPALNGFLDTIREGKPDTPILVVSPIFCPAAEAHPGPTLADSTGRFTVKPGLEELRLTCLTLTKVRSAVASIVATRRELGDTNVHYLDGLSLFNADDAAEGLLPDDLHPNAAGYVRMGERFAALAFGAGGALEG